jgi:hypothetical protein
MADRKDGKPKRKPSWRERYLVMDAIADKALLLARHAECRLEDAKLEIAEAHRLREGDEDRHAEERGALQRRIDELEKANGQGKNL